LSPTSFEEEAAAEDEVAISSAVMASYLIKSQLKVQS
jgi:hypothetical protein